MIPSISICLGSSIAPKWRRLVRAIQTQVGSAAQTILHDSLLTGDGSNVVQSWGDALGGPSAVHATANKFSMATNGAFRYISNSTENDKRLSVTVTGKTVEVWCVCRPSALPFTSYRGAVQSTLAGASATRFLVGDSGQSTWFAPTNGTCHRDGSSSTSAAAGWHVYKRYSDIAANNDSISIGNDVASSSVRSWQGDIAFVMTLTAQTNSTQQDAIFAELQTYYGITP